MKSLFSHTNKNYNTPLESNHTKTNIELLYYSKYNIVMQLR